jgi:hypothetical protein
LAGAYLHREGGPVLAPVASLESDGFPSDNALPEMLNGCLVQTRIEIARVFSNEFFTVVTKTNAGLPVNIENCQFTV